MKNALKFIGFVLIIFLIYIWTTDLHFTELRALPEVEGGEKKIIQTVEYPGGKAVLVENTTLDTFGVVKLKKKFGLYNFDGSTYGEYLKREFPFETVGFGDEESFIVAAKTHNNSNIKYIAIGDDIVGDETNKSMDITLNEVKEKKNVYVVVEIKNSYCMAVLDGYTQDNWTFRAFDEKGKMVAYEFPGGDPSFVE